MYIKKDIDFNDIYENCWSGAKYTVQRVSDENKENELMDLLEEIFGGRATDSQINDFLWFEPDYIYECLDISEDEDEDEEEDEEEEEEL